jgi:hypothetical protein
MPLTTEAMFPSRCCCNDWPDALASERLVAPAGAWSCLITQHHVTVSGASRTVDVLQSADHSRFAITGLSPKPAEHRRLKLIEFHM